ncbi:hypothetical protein ACNKHK_05830 [Shigella flexneri]
MVIDGERRFGNGWWFPWSNAGNAQVV